jgi:hypothetical protein
MEKEAWGSGGIGSKCDSQTKVLHHISNVSLNSSNISAKVASEVC